MATIPRIGIRSLFTPADMAKSFTGMQADESVAQRQRKDAALGEIRKTMSEKEVYGPYVSNVNKFLEDQVKSMSTQLDVDPSAFTDAVSQYTKYYNMSQQVKKFIDSAAESYKADEQVDYNTALNAVRTKYVKDGSLNELEANVNSGMDVEQAVLETPGALKEDVVLNDALSSLGDVKSVMDELKNIAADPRYGDQYLQQDSERLTTELNNAVEFDKSTGQVRLKDPEALRSLGITQMMLGNRRIAALMDQKLKAQGSELTDENREEVLMQSLKPFVSGNVAVEKKRQNLENNAWKKSLEWAKYNLDRNAASKTQPGSAPELISGKVAALYEVYLPGYGDQIRNALMSQNPQKAGAWDPYQRLDKDGNPVKSPDGTRYIGRSTELYGIKANIKGSEYALGNTYIDENMRIYSTGRQVIKSEQTKEPDVLMSQLQGQINSGKMNVPKGSTVVKEGNRVVVYGPDRAIPFDPANLQEVMPSTKDREQYNENAAVLEAMRRSFGSNTQPTNFNQIQEKTNKQAQSGTSSAKPFSIGDLNKQ